jgi:hypothetical protein
MDRRDSKARMMGPPKLVDPAPTPERNNKSRRPPDFRQEAFCLLILVAGAGFTRAFMALALRARSFARANFACKKALMAFRVPRAFVALALRARSFARANFACKKALMAFLLNQQPLGPPKAADSAPAPERYNKSRRPPDFRQEAFCLLILVAGAGFEPTTFGL